MPYIKAAGANKFFHPIYFEAFIKHCKLDPKEEIAYNYVLNTFYDSEMEPVAHKQIKREIAEV
jgi:uncharacterized protein YdaU (DUF1376 family)